MATIKASSASPFVMAGWVRLKGRPETPIWESGLIVTEEETGKLRVLPRARLVTVDGKQFIEFDDEATEP